MLGATIQRCRVHFMRNALACVGKKDRPIVTAALRTAFDQDTLADSKEHWTKLIEAFQPRHPKLAELMLRAEEDVLAYKTFPQAHWRQIHSTNPLERLNKEIKRRTNVVGIFPDEAAIRRLVGALMLEQNRRMGSHTSLHDAGNRRRHLRGYHHGPGENRRPVNRLNTQPENNLHHALGHYQNRFCVASSA